MKPVITSPEQALATYRAAGIEPHPSHDLTSAALASLRRAFGVEYALTLWPEWVWAIDNLDKLVENRGWPLPPAMIGKRIALHAGANIGGRKGAPATREGIEAVASMAIGAGWHVTEDGLALAGGALVFSKGDIVKRLVVAEVPRSAITSTVVLASCTAPSPVHSDDGWYTGDYGFRLADRQALPAPIHCSGAQGFWRLP